MSDTQIARILGLLRENKVLRPRDLNDLGIPHVYLHRMVDRGLLQRVSRGIYIAADGQPTEHYSLAEASKRVPHGVVCLLSALRFHGLGTQAPFEVWMAIDRKARLPKTDSTPIRFVRFSGLALTYGIEEHDIEGVMVRVYSAAKTIADCFKYRNRIGLDVALEALRDCWQQKKATMDDLWAAAKVCRVANIMRPYMESLT